MNIFNSDCDNNFDVFINCCQSLESGGVQQILLVKAAYQRTLVVNLGANPTQQQVEQALTAGITAGSVVMLPQGYGNYNGGAPVEGPGRNGTGVSLVGRNHEITFNVDFDKDNETFVNAISKVTNYYVWFCSGGRMYNPGKMASMIATMPIEEALTSVVRQVFSIKWNSLDLPISYPKPGDEFFACPGTFETPPFLMEVISFGNSGDTFTISKAAFITPTTLTCSANVYQNQYDIGGTSVYTIELKSLNAYMNETGSPTFTGTSPNRVATTFLTVDNDIPEGLYAIVFEVKGTFPNHTEIRSLYLNIVP